MPPSDRSRWTVRRPGRRSRRTVGGASARRGGCRCDPPRSRSRIEPGAGAGAARCRSLPLLARQEAQGGATACVPIDLRTWGSGVRIPPGAPIRLGAEHPLRNVGPRPREGLSAPSGKPIEPRRGRKFAHGDRASPAALRRPETATHSCEPGQDPSSGGVDVIPRFRSPLDGTPAARGRRTTFPSAIPAGWRTGSAGEPVKTYSFRSPGPTMAAESGSIAENPSV
jgi:hypothetical protein